MSTLAALEALNPYYEPPFGPLLRATWLRLYNRGLMSLPDCIGELQDLQRLGVHDNRLSDFPDTLSRLTNLTEIDMGNNQFSRLPDEMQYLRDLQVLSMYGNHVSEIPRWVTKLQRLARLDVAVNGETDVRIAPIGLRDLPCWTQKRDVPIFQRFELYNDLCLTSQGLTSIESMLCDFLEVNNLDLSNNMISSLPESVSSLKNLRNLVLGREGNGNKISSIPTSIGNLQELREVHLSSNELTDLPVEFSSLVQISRLSISSNKLSWIPDSVFELTNLFSLEIQNNPILDLSLAITNLTKLSDLHIEDQGHIDVLRGPRGITSLPCWTNRRKGLRTSNMTCADALSKLQLVCTSPMHAISNSAFVSPMQGFLNLNHGDVMQLIVPTCFNGWYRAKHTRGCGWVHASKICILPPGNYSIGNASYMKNATSAKSKSTPTESGMITHEPSNVSQMHHEELIEHLKAAGAPVLLCSAASLLRLTGEEFLSLDDEKLRRFPFHGDDLGLKIYRAFIHHARSDSGV